MLCDCIYTIYIILYSNAIIFVKSYTCQGGVVDKSGTVLAIGVFTEKLKSVQSGRLQT